MHTYFPLYGLDPGKVRTQFIVSAAQIQARCVFDLVTQHAGAGATQHVKSQGPLVRPTQAPTVHSAHEHEPSAWQETAVHATNALWRVDADCLAPGGLGYLFRCLDILLFVEAMHSQTQWFLHHPLFDLHHHSHHTACACWLSGGLQDLFKYLDILLFVEATIYQVDEENEALCEALTQQGSNNSSENIQHTFQGKIGQQTNPCAQRATIGGWRRVCCAGCHCACEQQQQACVLTAS